MKKIVIVLLHCGYWLMYLLLLALFFGMFLGELRAVSNKHELHEAFIAWCKLMAGLAIIPGAIGFYVNYSVLFHRLLKRKRFLLFFAALVLTGVVAGVAGLASLRLIATEEAQSIWRQSDAVVTIAIFIFFVATVNGVLGLVMNGFISWYGDIRLKEQLEKKNYETELALIKAQLNPHFLFNTINNIDVLIQKNPEKASLYLNKLSDMLRFLLYETKSEQIALETELSYIEKYIDLQRIRTSNPSFVVYACEGDPVGKMIAPALFIPFIENAFKYAGNKKVERAIEIQISISGNSISFRCRNEYSTQQQGPEPGGLGNELIRRRLELLYPENHRLHISNQHNTYLVELEVNT